MDSEALSKEVSYALRHAPWEYELELDDKGFVGIDQLLQALNESNHYKRVVTRNDIEIMIATSEKKRHEIVGDSIRAIYGHSIPNKITRREAVPPDVLYHGTTNYAANKILDEGLRPMRRQYVHLSLDIDTALRVGLRRNPSPVLLLIDSKEAYLQGVHFYEGNDRVWLADDIPAKFIKRLESHAKHD